MMSSVVMSYYVIPHRSMMSYHITSYRILRIIGGYPAQPRRGRWTRGRGGNRTINVNYSYYYYYYFYYYFYYYYYY